MESNLDQIARQIFSVPPKPERSIQLGLEECVEPNASLAEQMGTLAEILHELLREGIKVKWGAGQRMDELTLAQLGTLMEYVASYGYQLIVDSNPMRTPPEALTERTQLPHFRERVYDFGRKEWHEISFDFLVHR